MPDAPADADEVLRAIERDRLLSLVTADTGVAEAFHAADYQLITPTGAALTKSEYLGAIAAGTLRYRVFEPVSDIAVRRTGAAAVLRYQARIQIEEGDGSADFTCWHTDYYELRTGRWLVVWSQATMITPRG